MASTCVLRRDAYFMTRMPLKETRRLMLDMYDKYPPLVIAEMTGRTVGSIRCMASAMGMRSGGRGKFHAPYFTKNETEAIRQEYGITPVGEIARAFRRSVAAIHQKAHRLNLGRRRGKAWTKRDDRIVAAEYPSKGPKHVAFVLDRSIHSVKHRARLLGVRRSGKSRTLLGDCF